MKTRHTTREGTADVRRTMGGDTSNMRDEIVDWLRDAYAMERGLEAALKKQSENEDLGPSVCERAAAHLEETRRHAEAIKATLQSLGTDTSALKTGMGMTVQATKGMATKFARDERVKDLLDAYAMEHFEIACYTALAVAADRANMPEVAETCRQIIPDEERMAQFIMKSLPDEIGSYLFDAESSRV